MILNRERLDELYKKWNRPCYISPDPLETLVNKKGRRLYKDPRDREVAALVAAAMAYGNVSAMLPPIRLVLEVLGTSPRDYVAGKSETDIKDALTPIANGKGTVYRFAKTQHLVALLAGAGKAIYEQGSLEAAFLIGYRKAKKAGEKWPAVAGLNSLSGSIRSGAKGAPGHLLPDPGKGSACKRLCLFLRWMVRKDGVDPGEWENVDPADLLMPLDTWIHRIALRAGWTRTNTPRMKCVLEVSDALKEIKPEDPIRYDFALSRFGIRSGMNLDQLFDDLEGNSRDTGKSHFSPGSG